MIEMSPAEALFVAWALLFQVILIIHFALRRWRFGVEMRYGPLVYALGIPAAALSLFLLAAGEPWYRWIGGFLYLAWGTFGYYVEYVREVQWRSPIRWEVFDPYICLFLASVMFYWWPLALISRPLWYVGAVLSAVSTALNATSHKRPERPGQTA